MSGVEAPLYERWIAKLPASRPVGQCWPWQGALNEMGYGKVYGGLPEGKALLAHRVGYEMFRGPIPDGLVLDHLCRVRSCVNPSHLEAVTQAVNTQRGERWDAERCHRGHPWATSAYVRKTGRKAGVRECRVCRNEDRRRVRAA